jgi:hypothetical protein
MAKQEIFNMVDIEADGPIPGLYSMLSFGVAAFDIDKNLLGTFTRNLDLLPNATQHPDTMEFWNRPVSNKKAYDATRVNTVNPKSAMKDFADFLYNLPGTPIFVGYPALYDFKWIDYYFHAFYGSNPFGFSGGVDVKSYAWALLGGNLKSCTKRNMPKDWFDDLPHTHLALDDAIEQGCLWINILRYSKGLSQITKT